MYWLVSVAAAYLIIFNILFRHLFFLLAEVGLAKCFWLISFLIVLIATILGHKCTKRFNSWLVIFFDHWYI